MVYVYWNCGVGLTMLVFYLILAGVCDLLDVFLPLLFGVGAVALIELALSCSFALKLFMVLILISIF